MDSLCVRGRQKASTKNHFERSHSGFTGNVVHVLHLHTRSAHKAVRAPSAPLLFDRVTGFCLSLTNTGELTAARGFSGTEFISVVGIVLASYSYKSKIFVQDST